MEGGGEKADVEELKVHLGHMRLVSQKKLNESGSGGTPF